MPFKSEKQRKWMHANQPETAKKWEKEEKSVKEDSTSTHSGKTCDQAHPKTSHDEWEKNQQMEETTKRDYKDEYKKFQSSSKSKKYRAELNKYNRQKGTYGNGDKKDASHKGGKISGFEEQSKNRGRAEKSRLKQEQKLRKMVEEELLNSQGEQTDFKKGDIVKDINPDCPHHNSEGEVIKAGKDKVTFRVTNNGSSYKAGDELEKSVDQIVKLKEQKLTTQRLIEIIKEEYLKIKINEDEQGTYGYESGVAGASGADAEDANIDLYRKSIKALNLWVAEKGRPSQRVWRGGHPKSFESISKKLFPDEYKYVMAKAWTVPVREIPFYYGQIAGQSKDKPGTGGYGGAELTGKEKSWQGQKGSGIAGKGNR